MWLFYSGITGKFSQGEADLPRLSKLSASVSSWPSRRSGFREFCYKAHGGKQALSVHALVFLLKVAACAVTNLLTTHLPRTPEVCWGKYCPMQP